MSSMYQLPHELLNKLRLKILENEQILERFQIKLEYSILSSPPSKNEILAIA